MPLTWIALGALLAGLSVVGGAFGAHALAARLDARGLELWETAARYLMYGGLSLVLLGIVRQQWPRPGFVLAGISLLLGTLIFSGTVAALALGSPRWLGAVTPIGGTLMIVGYALFAWTAIRG